MVDLGEVIQGPTRDKDWIKKCALMGVITFALFLVPIAGAIVGGLNLLGWMRAATENKLRGDHTIPEIGLGYIGRGWSVFVMFLPLVGVLLFLAALLVGGVAGGAALDSPGLAAASSLIGTSLFCLALLYLTVFQPAILYLFLVDNEPWASVRFGRQIELARRAGLGDYVLFFLSFLVAGVVAQVGVAICLVGVVVTMPFAQLMQASAIAELKRTLGARG